MIAWELQVCERHIGEGFDVPAHKEILHLQANMDFGSQITTLKTITRDHWLDFFKDKPRVAKAVRLSLRSRTIRTRLIRVSRTNNLLKGAISCLVSAVEDD